MVGGHQSLVVVEEVEGHPFHQEEGVVVEGRLLWEAPERLAWAEFRLLGFPASSFWLRAWLQSFLLVPRPSQSLIHFLN